MGARTVHLAFDACDAGLVERYAAEGDMPTLAMLLRTGARAETRAPYAMYPSSLWVTTWSGIGYDRHGYHCWNEIVPGTYDTRDTTLDLLEGEPYWNHLSDAGLRVAALDVPHTRFRRPINGIQLSEWASHDRHTGCNSWPESFAEEVDREFGPHPIGGSPGPGSLVQRKAQPQACVVQ